jgi:PAS domain S-box-containing protein
MLQLVLDTIPVRVFWKDLESRYLGCNMLFARDAGREKPEDLIGEDDFAMGWRNEAELYRADDRAVMESGEARVNYEEPQTTPDGKQIWLRTSKLPLRDADGEVIGVLGTYEDITAEKKAEERERRLEAQFQHAQKLESLGVLAGGIAHDFNNLLTGVLGHANLALAGMESDTPFRINLEGIRKAANRAADLCRQMLAYSGKGRFRVEPIDLSEVVREMGEILDVSVSKKASLRFDLADDLPAIEGDPAQVRQIVLNLITNASEAIGDQVGVIAVRTSLDEYDADYLAQTHVDDRLPAGEYVTLEVTDSGCGMDVEAHQRLFEPFFTTKFTGRGLGLAAVLGIVRSHRGAIDVRSAPGRGTRFRVLIPPGTRIATRGDVEEEPRELWSGSGTVLVVDDEEIVIDIARATLETAGLNVLTASDGIEALEVLDRQLPEIDCVLLDLTMPRMDGEEAFKEIREMDPNLPIVLTSGYNEQEVTQRFVGQDLAGFVQKPFELDMLLRAVGEAIDRRERDA